ncbi:MAG TPA: hypothetical protein VFG77_01095 [Nitrososphaeraceae archaeon]|nr:hypothetical protein [Nitrososphaeraceae archaeon]
MSLSDLSWGERAVVDDEDTIMCSLIQLTSTPWTYPSAGFPLLFY